MKRTPVILAVTLCLPLTACGGAGSQDYGQRSQAVCMDPITEQRYADDYCDSDDHDDDGMSATSAFLWAYMLYGSRVPAVGSSLHGYGYDRTPPKSYVRGGAPYYGGKVSQSSLREGAPVGFDAPKPTAGRTATPKPSPSASAKTSAPAKTLAPAAPASPKASAPKPSKKSWLSGLSGKACGKFTSRSGGTKSYSSGGGSKSWGSSGTKSSGSSSSKKSSSC